MHATPTTRRRALAAGLLVIAGVGGAAGLAIGSDHQDTPEVELNPRTGHDRRLRVPGLRAGADRSGHEQPRLSHSRGNRRRRLLRPRSPLPVQGRQRRRRPRGPGDPGDVHRQRCRAAGRGARSGRPAGPGCHDERGRRRVARGDRRDQHAARVLRGPPGVRRSAGRSVLLRPRGRLLHPPRPEAGRRTAGRALRAHAESRARRSTSAIQASTTSRASTCCPSWSSCRARCSRTARRASSASGERSAADAASPEETLHASHHPLARASLGVHPRDRRGRPRGRWPAATTTATAAPVPPSRVPTTRSSGSAIRW